MATINFNMAELDKGRKLLSFNENAKECKDCLEAERIVLNYRNTGNYNQQYAIQLDNKLRQEYKEINTLENLISSLPVIQSPINFNSKPVTQEPVGIRNLQFDVFGIIFRVLCKQNPTYKVADYILKVVGE